MEFLFSILVAIIFMTFLGALYFVAKVLFPKIENDDWEERFVQMKQKARHLAKIQKHDYNHEAID